MTGVLHMFNEREASRLRLEQLNEAEVKVIREYQIERDKIYAKLRELDNTGDLSDTKKSFVRRKSDSLPVLAELAETGNEKLSKAAGTASILPAADAVYYVSSRRHSRRFYKKKKRDGETGIKSGKTARSDD